MDKDKRILVLKWVGYPIFFVACVAFFFNLTLPVDQIKGLVQREMEHSAGYRIEAASTGAGLFGGLVFKDVTIMAVGADPKDPKAPKLRLDELSVSLPLLRTLLGRRAVALGVKGFEGSASGTIGAKETRQDVDLSFSDINLARLGMLWESLGMKFVGRIGGAVDLTYDTKDAKKDNGSVKVVLNDLVMTEGKFSGFEVPRLAFGKIQMKIEVKDGKAEVKEFKGKGKDIEVKGDGTISLTPKLSQSALAVKIRFKPSDEFVQRNQKIQPLIYAIQGAKDKEGFFAYQLTGALEHPFFTQAK